MTATRQLSEFIATADPAGIEADHPLVVGFYDAWCATVAGRTTDANEILRQLDQLGVAAGVADACDAASPQAHAFRRAALAVATGMDATTSYGGSDAVIWAALGAVARREQISDVNQVCAAYAVGVNAADALCAAGGYNEAHRGFSNTAVFGVLAATAACSRLLALDAAIAHAALSIAASQAGGLVGNHASSGVWIHAANAARDAVMATLLATGGFSGAPDIVEARQGFGEAFFGLGRLENDRLQSELDARRRRLPVVFAKRVAGHADLQRPAQALAQLREPGAEIDERAHVVVDGVRPTSEAIRVGEPQSAEQRLFSMQFVLACILQTGNAGLMQVSARTSTAPVTADAIEAIEIRCAPRWDERLHDPEYVAQSITLMNGGTNTSAYIAEISRQLAPAEVFDKWRQAAAGLDANEDGAAADALRAVLGAADANSRTIEDIFYVI